MADIWENYSVVYVKVGHPTGQRRIDLEDLSIDGSVETEDKETVRDRVGITMNVIPSEEFKALDELQREATKAIRKGTAKFPLVPNSTYRLVPNSRMPEVAPLMEDLEGRFYDTLEWFVTEVYPDLRTEHLKKTVDAGLALYDDVLRHRPGVIDRDKFQLRLEQALQNVLPTAEQFKSRTYFDWKAFTLNLTAGANQDVAATECVASMLEEVRSELKDCIGKIAKKLRTGKKYGDSSLEGDRKALEEIIDANVFGDSSTTEIAKKALDKILTSDAKDRRNRAKRAAMLDDLAKEVSIDVNNGAVAAVAERLTTTGMMKD
jgi:hypothetical protein